ncbi:MAG: chitobiase/beta-hexosaminidase C-terminal domain-containing protein [bacterium]|nr:chitobiase/beta-hexosaminidase C-terminal domain-containing protein [bacterium]
MILESQPGVSIKYTTDGSDPKNNGGTYDGEFKIPINTAFVQVIAEHDGAFYDSHPIPIEKGTEVSLIIDKAKLLVLSHLFRVVDTSETYNQLALLKKYAQIVKDVRMTLYKKDDSGRNAGWIDLTLSDNIETNVEQIENAINNLKNSFVADSRVNIELEWHITMFKNGQSFMDFANDRGNSLSEFKQGEINQE